MESNAPQIVARQARMSSRQRVLVLTFPDAAAAERWDRCPERVALAALLNDKRQIDTQRVAPEPEADPCT